MRGWNAWQLLQEASANAIVVLEKVAADVLRFKDQSPDVAVIVFSVVIAVFLLAYEALWPKEEEEHVSDQPEGVVIEDVSEDFTTSSYVEPEQRIRDVASPMRVTTVGDMTISATGGIVEMAERQRERRSRRSATPVPMVNEVRRDLKGAVLDRLNDDNFGPEKLSELRYLGPVMVNRVMIKRRSGGFESLDEVHKILGMPHARKVVQSVEDSLRRNST